MVLYHIIIICLVYHENVAYKSIVVNNYAQILYIIPVPVVL